MKSSQHVVFVRLVYDSHMTVITHHLSPFLVIQNVGRVKRLDRTLSINDCYEVWAVNDGKAAKGCLQMSKMRCFSTTKRVLRILNQVDSDPDVDALVSSGINAACVNDRTLIVVIALSDPEFVVLLLYWKWRGQLRGLLGPHAALNDCSIRTQQCGDDLQVLTATRPSCKIWMGTSGTSSPPRWQLHKWQRGQVCYRARGSFCAFCTAKCPLHHLHACKMWQCPLYFPSQSL